MPQDEKLLPNPEITRSTLENWQKIVDLAAKVMNVPAALIMKVHTETIEVFVSSQSDGNPYEINEMADLNTGLYCETVMKTDKMLVIPNALKDPKWANNPDIELGMISYLGYPVHWPDGNIFGTICILDNQQNAYNAEFIEMLERLRDNVELELQHLATIESLQKANKTIDVMSELIPICSECKKIRDDKGYWERLEVFLQEEKGLVFTHGYCPDCYEKMMEKVRNMK